MRVVIVDDEPLARRKLRRHLERETDVEIVAECQSGQEAVDLLRSTQIDVLLLDIQMPEHDGFAVLDALGSERPVVIFVTAHDAHAIRAFEQQALDYLLKPYDGTRFRRSLQRARDHLTRVRRKASDIDLDRLRAALESAEPKPTYPDRILVKSGEGSELIRVVEIERLEADGNYVRIHVGRRVHTMRATLRQLEQRLDPSRFVRIHRGHIVNLDRIRRLDPLFHGDMTVTLEDGTELTLSRSYRERLRQLWPGLS